jgi:hypothetical protein
MTTDGPGNSDAHEEEVTADKNGKAYSLALSYANKFRSIETS